MTDQSPSRPPHPPDETSTGPVTAADVAPLIAKRIAGTGRGPGR